MLNLGGFFDVPKKEAELKKLEEEISDPNFWNNQDKAQKVVQKRSRIEKALENQKAFENEIADAGIKSDTCQLENTANL